MNRRPENMTGNVRNQQTSSGGGVPGAADGQQVGRMRKGPSYIWMLLSLFGVGFIVLGVAQGEVLTVLRKAAAICLECIGIG